MSRYRIFAVCLVAIACGGCATLPPLKNYTLPNTNKVSFATCYVEVGWLSGGERPKNFFPKDAQEKNAYVINKTREALEKHGYKVTMMEEGCKKAFDADNKSIRVVQRFMQFPAPAHEMLVQTFLVPPFWKKEYAIVQITYGPLHQSVEKSVQEIPPILLQKIAEGKAANKPTDIPQDVEIKTASHGAVKEMAH